MEEKKYELYVVEVITLGGNQFPVAGVKDLMEAETIFYRCHDPHYKGCVILGYIDKDKFEIIDKWIGEKVE